jgi:hypothetical protein
MVSTRRQSGKLPLPLAAAPADDGTSSDEEDDIDGYSSPETNTDDDDFARKRYSGNSLFHLNLQMLIYSECTAKKGRLSTKRAKTKDTLPRKTAKRKAKGVDLSRIVDMPLDILFEVYVASNTYDVLPLMINFSPDIRTRVAQRPSQFDAYEQDATFHTDVKASHHGMERRIQSDGRSRLS